MPVQRIPRYKLLLTELLKHTPEDHPDYEVRAVETESFAKRHFASHLFVPTFRMLNY